MNIKATNVRKLFIWSLALLVVASLALIETSARTGHAALRHGATANGEEWGGEEGHHGGEEGGGEEWGGEEAYGVPVTDVGAVFVRLPAAAKSVVIDGTTYWFYDNTYYVRGYSGGAVIYRVVPEPW
jgi:hypothetical protein